MVSTVGEVVQMLQMKWDDSILKFKIVVTLPAGEFNFRVNSDWGENYGDDGADGT